jgi:hypothetical protein
VVGILIFQRLNKSSTPKKGSLMNLVVVLNAVQQRKHKPEIKAAVAVAMLVNNAKCSQQFALPAGKKRLFLSNLPATSLFIAVSAINLAHAATGKMFLKTFPSLNTWKGFFLPLRLPCRVAAPPLYHSPNVFSIILGNSP